MLKVEDIKPLIDDLVELNLLEKDRAEYKAKLNGQIPKFTLVKTDTNVIVKSSNFKHLTALMPTIQKVSKAILTQDFALIQSSKYPEDLPAEHTLSFFTKAQLNQEELIKLEDAIKAILY